MRLFVAVAAITIGASGCNPSNESDNSPNYIEPVQLSLELEDAVINVDVWGAGEETIVALPGLGSDTSWFKFLAPRVAAAGYRFVAMNPRGVRGSTGSIDNLSLQTMANDVAEVIEALGAEKAHIIGWAFGNRIARATASSHPNRVATVILLAAGGRVQPSKEAWDAMIKVTSSDDLSEEQRIDLYKASLYSPSSDVMAIIDSVPFKRWPEARNAQLIALNDAVLSEWWSGGQAQMLVVQGLDDKIAVPENGYLLKTEFASRITLEGIPDAGHLLLVERPDEVAKAVISFLEHNSIAEVAESG